MPSVTSTSCSDARSTCEYDFTAPSSAVIRAVDSFISASSARRRQRARHPVETRLERVALEDLGRPLAPRDVDAGRRERRRDAPAALDVVRVEPVRERLLRGRRPRAGRPSWWTA